MRRHQLGAVDLHKRLAFANRLTGRVDVELFDPTLELGRQGVLAALVDLHRTDCAHCTGEHAALNWRRQYTQQLHLLRADGNGVTRFITLINGDVVHTHGVLLRHRGGVRQTHGIAVVTDLALALRGSRRLVGVDRDVVHPHRILLGHWRGIGQAHGVAVVENLALLWGSAASRLRGTCLLRCHVAATEAGDCRNEGKRACAENHAAFHSSAPTRRSNSTTCTRCSSASESSDSRSWRICRWASSKVAKSTLPV